MEFEFDPEKSEKNREERGFGFDLAYSFDFGTAVIFEDRRKNYDESRYIAVNRIDGEPFRIAFTFRGENLRIITMFRIHEKEAKRYGI